MILDLQTVAHNPAVEAIVDVLCNKTQNIDRGFFRIEVAYFLAKMASCMRAVIVTKDRGEIPVNIYALALATSGFGKGHSIAIIENEFLKGFKSKFIEDTFPLMADANLWKFANEKSMKRNSDPKEEYESLCKEFNRAGSFPFTFDSGTTPAVKQLRNKLLLANCGAINLQIDEIGSNLIGSVDVLNVFLELYDQGLVKQKLVKNTNDNIRSDEIDGKTPTNMLLFGTPSRLLDGATVEDQFYSFLETGYARRCLFGFGVHKPAFESLNPEEIYRRLIQPTNNSTINSWADTFEMLADPTMFNWKMSVEDDIGIALLTYKIECEKFANTLPEHEEIKKAEISHRYFKALKLAGTFAFIDQSTEIEEEHLSQAIKLVEESGEAFQSILNREKSYVKLAKFIAEVGNEVTHADLLESLPFYPKSNTARNEMILLATAWAYKKHIIIKKKYNDGIEFFLGEKLKETDLEEISISYSDHWAYNYINEKVPFDKLGTLFQADGYHWANHSFKNGHRAEENVIPGFNIIVLDVDEGISIDSVKDLLKEYKFILYSTKRSTPEANRFRIIIPINYILQLSTEEYKEFMNSILEWLPFKSDESTNQRAKKWESFAGGEIFYNEGGILDILEFIPKTSRNEQYKQSLQKLESLDNLERWFAQRIAMGNRNNNMIKFALALVDSGMSLIDVQKAVNSFNSKLSSPLSDNELEQTVLTTVAKRFQRSKS